MHSMLKQGSWACCKWMQQLARPQPVLALSQRFVTHKTTDKDVALRFRSLPTETSTAFITYVWIDGTGEHIRSKTKVYRGKDDPQLKDISAWSFDGSSTYQAEGANSDLEIVPVRLCPDPFYLGSSRIALCEVYDGQGKPVGTNRRASCLEAFEQSQDQEPKFGFEQEYTLIGADGRPFGFPSEGVPNPQGPYYCSAGAGNAIGRDVSDSHMVACEFAGLDIYGTNAEVMPGQWEFQTGAIQGVDAADQLWLARYLLHRVGEEFGVGITFDPKPATGDWNGAGCHTNFNTKAMIEEGGIKHIYDAVELLKARHDKHIKGYDPKGGLDNIRRMTGKHETARIDEFTSGEAARTASIRIPRYVVARGKGFFEDRRPAANMDPYVVCDLLMRTVCLRE